MTITNQKILINCGYDPDKDTHHNKFYIVWEENNGIFKRYGRIGTDGKVIRHPYSGNAKYLIEGMVQEKVNKGYKVTTQEYFDALTAISKAIGTTNKLYNFNFGSIIGGMVTIIEDGELSNPNIVPGIVLRVYFKKTDTQVCMVIDQNGSIRRFDTAYRFKIGNKYKMLGKLSYENKELEKIKAAVCEILNAGITSI